MRIVGFAALAAAIGCGDVCREEDLTGTYRVVATEVSGDCGPIGTFMARYTDGEPDELGTGCTAGYDRRSEDGCKNERSTTCIGDGTRTVGSGVINTEPGGDEASGSLTMTVYETDSGAVRCMSTYDVTYTRQ